MVYRKLLCCLKLSNGFMVELSIAGAALPYQRVFFLSEKWNHFSTVLTPLRLSRLRSFEM